MLNFDVKKSSRKCFDNQQDFLPGEVFFSALVETEDGGTERRDFCQEHWNDAPESCIGWWKAKVPDLGKGKVYWAPRKVLLAYFVHVLANKNQQDIAFVTGLLLVQKRILTLDDDGVDPTVMHLRNRVGKESYVVPVFDFEGIRLQAIQAELAERLFMDEPIDEFEDDESDDDQSEEKSDGHEQ